MHHPMMIMALAREMDRAPAHRLASDLGLRPHFI